MQSNAQRFHKLFTGLDRAHGEMVEKEKDPNKGNKVKSQHATIRTGATVELWERHLAGKKAIGVPPLMDDGNVWFGAIDIDINDIDHVALERKVQELGLPLVVMKSKSSGAHVYLFLSEPTSAELVRGRLVSWAGHLGHPGVEVFPKQTALANNTDDVGNWINMPYFGGTRVCVYAGREQPAEKFLDFAEASAITTERLTEINLDGVAEYDGMPPCLSTLCKSGFPEGTRNQGMFNGIVYLKMLDPDGWEAAADDFNEKYMDPPLPASEMTGLLRQSRQGKNYFYTCNQPPINSVCNKDMCRQSKYGIGTSESQAQLLPPIDNLVKRGDDPPVWYVNVDGKRLQLTSPQLTEYRLFTLAVADKFTVMLPPLKQGKWRQIVANLMKECVHEDAPVDASFTGQLIEHVNAFLTRRQHSDNRDDVANGGVYVNEHGIATFRASDLMEYLAHKRFTQFKAHEVYAALHDIGAAQTSFNVKGAFIRAWTLPITNEQKEDFDTPEIPTGGF